MLPAWITQLMNSLGGPYDSERQVAFNLDDMSHSFVQRIRRKHDPDDRTSPTHRDRLR